MFKMVFSIIFKSPKKNPARLRKIDKDFTQKIDLKDVKFPVKIRDIHKIEKKNQ